MKGVSVTKDHINRLANVTYDINTKFGEKLDTADLSSYGAKVGS